MSKYFKHDGQNVVKRKNVACVPRKTLKVSLVAIQNLSIRSTKVVVVVVVVVVVESGSFSSCRAERT